MKKIDIGSLQKKKYLNNIKLLAKFKSEKSSAYVYLVATFLSLTVLIVSAIGPTIGTIVELQKKLEDSKKVDTELDLKIQNMSVLRNQYNQIATDISTIENALPKDPSTTDLIGRIQAVVAQSNVEVLYLDVKNVPVKLVAVESVEESQNSFNFSLSVKGDYASVVKFFKSISTFDRIVGIPSFSVSRVDQDAEGSGSSTDRILTIEGKAYFQ